MRESEIESYLRREVRRAGGRCDKLAPTVAGIPDRLVLLPGGGIYLVEMKQQSGALRPAQRAWHAHAERLGTPVYVLWSKQDVDSFLSGVLDA